jgi:hypothetical protein
MVAAPSLPEYDLTIVGAGLAVQDAGAAATLNAQPNSVPVPLALRNSGRQDSTITGIR